MLRHTIKKILIYSCSSSTRHTVHYDAYPLVPYEYVCTIIYSLLYSSFIIHSIITSHFIRSIYFYNRKKSNHHIVHFELLYQTTEVTLSILVYQIREHSEKEKQKIYERT